MFLVSSVGRSPKLQSASFVMLHKRRMNGNPNPLLTNEAKNLTQYAESCIRPCSVFLCWTPREWASSVTFTAWTHLTYSRLRMSTSLFMNKFNNFPHRGRHFFRNLSSIVNQLIRDFHWYLITTFVLKKAGIPYIYFENECQHRNANLTLSEPFHSQSVHCSRSTNKMFPQTSHLCKKHNDWLVRPQVKSNRGAFKVIIRIVMHYLTSHWNGVTMPLYLTPFQCEIC